MEGLEGDFGGSDGFFLGIDYTSKGTERMTRLVLSCATVRIPKRAITWESKSHPWLNDSIVQLVAKKHAGSGTPDFAEAVQECSKAIGEVSAKYAGEARKKLGDARRGSKLWWIMSRELQSREPQNNCCKKNIETGILGTDLHHILHTREYIHTFPIVSACAPAP